MAPSSVSARNGRDDMMTREKQSPKACACEICDRYADLSMPRDLIREVAGGNAVIFAGSGITTEGGSIHPYSLSRQVSAELRLEDDESEDLPKLLSRYCEQPNGRQKLINIIKKREDVVCSFSELYNIATEFHQELSTIYNIQEIITTNWDDYFERECAATPVVTDHDFAMRRVEGRKVFKIHGSINNLGSIVATLEDHAEFHDRLRDGELGSALSKILSNRVVIYFGYSLNDKYFTDMHRVLEEKSKKNQTDFYIVTPSVRAVERCPELNIVPIEAASCRFLASMKEHLQADAKLLPDDRFDGLADIYDEAVRVHTDAMHRYDLEKYPTAMLTGSYQDGVLHALERIERRWHSGEYAFVPKIENVLRYYDHLKAERLGSGGYIDAAYLEGYRDGVALLLQSDEERKGLPILYIFGLEDQPTSLDEFECLLAKGKEIHGPSYELCRKFVDENASRIKEIVFHHRPFI